MKRLSIIATFMAFFFSRAEAQQMSKWELGIQAEAGRDWYHRDYYNMDELPSGYIEKFPSYRSLGAGIFAERMLSSKFSLLGQLNYTQKKMPSDIFGEPSTTGARWVRKEVHHRGAADIGLRWYVNQKSQVRLFVDGKLGANMLIAAVQRVEGFGNVVTWDAFGYRRINPVASGSVGVKWRRLTVSAEYRQDLSAVKRNRTATGIKGQALVGKVALTLIK